MSWATVSEGARQSSVSWGREAKCIGHGNNNTLHLIYSALESCATAMHGTVRTVHQQHNG